MFILLMTKETFRNKRTENNNQCKRDYKFSFANLFDSTNVLANNKFQVIPIFRIFFPFKFKLCDISTHFF